MFWRTFPSHTLPVIIAVAATLGALERHNEVSPSVVPLFTNTTATSFSDTSQLLHAKAAITTMGLTASKSNIVEGEMILSKELTLEGGTANASYSNNNKRNSSRTSNRLRLDECFGLDESQSRSTESTQGSPELDLYPSKSTREARKSSFGSSAGAGSRPKWFRRQSSSAVGAQELASQKGDCLPPSFLVFKQNKSSHGSSSSPTLTSSSSSSGKTAPVPVQTRKTQSAKTLKNHWGSLSDGGNTASDHHARVDELQRMYDMRTWDMYIRITEARKNKPAPTMIPHHHSTQPLPLSKNDGYDYFIKGDESLHDEHDTAVDVSQSEEMIFGDLE